MSGHAFDEGVDVRRQLRLLLANRRSPEARALFDRLTRYTHRRVALVSRQASGSLSPTEQEEVVAEVLLQLMQGSLAAFRGETVPELLGFVRLPAPDAQSERVARSPLTESDQAYLIELLQAGSKAELARRAGVSRAAVTQRVQRIHSRVRELATQDRIQHEVWLEQAARRVVAEETLADG
jgi:hypothetical protein